MAKTPGATNKNKVQADVIANKLGCDPFEILILYTKGDWKSLGYKNKTETKYTAKGQPYEADIINAELRFNAAKEACKYLYAQIKAIEHSASEGTQLVAPLIYRPPSTSKSE